MKKKTLPKTKQHVDVGISFKSIDEENRRITGIVASDGLIDRHGESLNPSGWKINGHVPILWGHKYDEFPVGKTTQEKVENDQLVVDVRLSKKYKIAQDLFDLITENIVDKVSVGFIPLKYDDSGDFTYAEMELLEVSFVTIPANPRAGLKKKDLEKIQRVEEGLNKMLAEIKKENEKVEDKDDEDEGTEPKEGEEKAENEAKEKADSPQEPEEKPELKEKTVSDDDKSDPPEEKEEKTITLTKDELKELLKEAVKESKEEPKDNNEPEEKTLMEQLVEMRDALRDQYTGTAKTLEQINKYLKTERK